MPGSCIIVSQPQFIRGGVNLGLVGIFGRKSLKILGKVFWADWVKRKMSAEQCEWLEIDEMGHVLRVNMDRCLPANCDLEEDEPLPPRQRIQG